MELKGFEAAAKEAMLDELEQTARQEWAPKLLERASEILREYGERHDYDVEPVIESAEPRVERREGHVTVRITWPHPAAPYFQMGTSDHPVDGNDILSFIWDDAPQSVHEKWPDTERVDGDPRVFLPSVNVDGLPESRFVRDALNWLRREVAR